MAKEALLALQKEVKENRQRWETLRKLWNAKEKTVMKLCEMPQDVKAFLNTQAQNVFISSSMMQEHKLRHKEIGAFEYSLIPFLLNDSELSIYQDKSPKNPNKFIVVNKLNRWFRLSLKSLKEKNEIWVESLMSHTNKDKLVKNKVLKWKRD